MQIIFQDTSKSLIKVQTQGLDDLWTLFNIIRPNDLVSGRTTRRVVKRDGDKGERKPMNLEIRVESVEFHEYSNRLRVKGQITQGPDEYVSIGQYHTINVEINTKIAIIKEKWFKHDIQRLKRSTGVNENKIVMAVALESGLATIGLISNYSLSIAASVRHNIPGKRYKKQGASKELEEFFEETATVIIENIKTLQIQLIAIMGPGFLKEQFQEFLKNIFKKEKLEIDSRVLSASSGTDSAIYEILKRGDISNIISDHKISLETAYMEEFVTRLGKDNGLFTYGFEDTLRAAQSGAIERLMVTDLVMRTISIDRQHEIETLFNEVENGRGEVNILSTLSPAGEQLDKYGGIASLLRYKIQ